MSEYWITEDDIIYCDGDAGIDVPNHEMVVLSHAMYQVVARLSRFDDPLAMQLADLIEVHYVDGCVDVVAYREELSNRIDEWVADKLISTDEAQDIDAAIVDRFNIDETLYAIANGMDIHCQRTLDSRAYAIEQWGWIRVRGNNFELKTIAADALRSIEDFLVAEDYSETASVCIESHDPPPGIPRYIPDIPATALTSERSLRRYLRDRDRLLATP